jgi:hypothetical protein
MKKVGKIHQETEFRALVGLMAPGLSEKVFNNYKLTFVTFELADADGSQPLKLEMASWQARLFWRWLEANDFCDR